MEKKKILNFELYKRYMYGEDKYIKLLEDYNITWYDLKIFTDKMIKSDSFTKSSITFGVKDSPYYSNEDEMLVPEYRYDDLSQDEKSFYENYKCDE